MKPRVGIFGLSGCWGEQIVILNCEDELLSLVGAIDLVDFLGGSSANDREGPLDVALVEGSVAGPRQQEALRRIRARATHLVACSRSFFSIGQPGMAASTCTTAPSGS
jgi:sulfhydrogenase subunit delta